MPRKPLQHSGKTGVLFYNSLDYANNKGFSRHGLCGLIICALRGLNNGKPPVLEHARRRSRSSSRFLYSVVKVHSDLSAKTYIQHRNGQAATTEQDNPCSAIAALLLLYAVCRQYSCTDSIASRKTPRNPLCEKRTKKQEISLGLEK